MNNEISGAIEDFFTTKADGQSVNIIDAIYSFKEMLGGNALKSGELWSLGNDIRIAADSIADAISNLADAIREHGSHVKN